MEREPNNSIVSRSRLAGLEVQLTMSAQQVDESYTSILDRIWIWQLRHQARSITSSKARRRNSTSVTSRLGEAASPDTCRTRDPSNLLVLPLPHALVP